MNKRGKVPVTDAEETVTHPPLTGWGCVCVCVGRLGLICQVQGRDEVISSLPGLSRLHNVTLITGCLKRQLCMELREQTDQQSEGLG